MPFCTQCAHQNHEGAKFCASCGAPIAKATPQQADLQPVGAGAPASPAPHARTPQTGTPISTSSAETVTSADSPSSGGIHGRFVPGTRLGTRYRVVALLGRGGMGEVYRADDLELGQSVALKFLPAGLAASPTELLRFRSEVRTARLIAHPNVCRVYDIGEAAGHVFLSMEYIDGEDLAAVLRRMGRPTPDKAIEIARQICLGLAAAHETGMLHRDLKPANVMIDGRGRARITDFGLAGLIDELKRGDEIAGTPAYMAPEQLVHGRVSVKSDVYSLGLVLYELFTGRRAFEGTSIAELRQEQDSGSITTPSDIARGVDPAVERVILQCLERDPDARPSSAYAVLGALPGGDPLAAALAAGEIPSPELVANATDRGTLSPIAAVGYVVLGIVGLVVNAAIVGPEFRPLTEPTEVLSVRAGDVLSKTGGYDALPKFTAEGFDQNSAYMRFVRRQPKGLAFQNGEYFWRRWSPRAIEPTGIHRQLARLYNPPMIALGEAAVMLDPTGRLIGLRAAPPDSVHAKGSRPAWSVLWTAAGFDSSTLTPAPLARSVPVICDSAAAWTTSLPWNAGEKVTVQAGASRGRLVHFTIVHDWGITTAPIDSLAFDSDPDNGLSWVNIMFTIVPVIASVYFAVRNLRLGRGDWRGATRIAVFVYLMNILAAVFAMRLTRVGLGATIVSLFDGRAGAHAVMHAMEMWFAYIALEPYVRRLWPRMLISWTRLISGRVRDPLVGRDLLIGGTAGGVFTAMIVSTGYLMDRWGLARVPSQITTEYLESLTSLPSTGSFLSISASICVLDVLGGLVMLLIWRLILRRTWASVLTTVLTTWAIFVASSAMFGLSVAMIISVISILPLLVLMRYGLLAATVTVLVMLILGSVVATLDVSAWYADRALVASVIIVGLMLYGAATALAGKSILGDPLRESAVR